MGPRKVKLDTYRKRSVVWSFFTDIDEGSVQCVLCNRYLHKKEHGSTTPMLRHLRLKHPTQVYRGMERDHEASASHDHQHMEIDDEQIISVVVSVDDDESNTRTTQNDSDPSTAVSGLYETSPRGSLAHLIHEDDLSHIPNKQSRRRSLIWRLFEHLDNLNAARCRICMKKLHKSGGISNLRRHLVKRHPKVLSELLSTNHRPAVPSQDVNVAGVSRESYIGTEPHQAPVKLVLDDGESHIMTTLNETIPGINNLPGMPQGGLAEKIIEAEDSNADGTGGTMWDSGQKWFPVEVRVEDDSSDVMTPSIEPDGSHIINDNPDSLQEGLMQDAFHSEAGENSSERPQTKDRRRSVIWRHFERLESSEAAQCRICMRKLQCYDSGCTGNLHRHLSKRHPKVFSELGSNSLKQLSPDSNGHGGTTESPLIKHELSVRPSFPSAGLKISRQPEVEVRVFERELELIEALRRTQREEAQALQQQRELLEKLQTVGAREAAAERETIESLRKAQQEEADELIRQREELEKEKAELRKKWEELYQEKEEFSLLSKSKETH
ncbi:uncharacterized protein LOC103462547 isoform X1 [Poecilia reticulata]|uniref:uncharacterized protein LOC103462547 isoform X1 n=1 Tax=Poecilia reticulata TaxID=8081 RepID=UPI0004A2418B|nr:PREDICTED: uncharacterized protein LOC103462547 isoform X1 [Poecilia reticulata]